MSNDTTTAAKSSETEAAIELHAKLAAIEIGDVRRNVTLERSAPRKELAAAVRKLFKTLGLKGISVTAPNYSMAQSIDVHQPARDDYKMVEGSRYDVADDCEARAANNAAAAKLREILYAAFPSHRDRSDSQSDHFDYKFSIR